MLLIFFTLGLEGKVIRFLWPYVMNFHNQPECSSLTSLSRILLCFLVRQEPTLVKHLSGAPLQCRLLALATNNRLGWKACQMLTLQLFIKICNLQREKSIITLSPGGKLMNYQNSSIHLSLMEQKTLKNVKNCLNININFYVETSSNPIINFVLFRHLWQLKTVIFIHWCQICAVLLTYNFIPPNLNFRNISKCV